MIKVHQQRWGNHPVDDPIASRRGLRVFIRLHPAQSRATAAGSARSNPRQAPSGDAGRQFVSLFDTCASDNGKLLLHVRNHSKGSSPGPVNPRSSRDLPNQPHHKMHHQPRGMALEDKRRPWPRIRGEAFPNQDEPVQPMKSPDMRDADSAYQQVGRHATTARQVVHSQRSDVARVRRRKLRARLRPE